MSQWLEQVIARGEASKDWLAPIRQQAIKQLKQEGWPSKRSEAWRFTPLSAVEKFDHAQTIDNNRDTALATIEGLNAIELVFCGDRLLTDISAIVLPRGMSIVEFTNANEHQQEQMKKMFAKVKPSTHTFGLINDALSQQGLFIRIDDNAHIDSPLKITQLTGSGAEQHLRVLVSVGKNAKATIIEHGEGSHASINTAFAEYELDQNSRLEHYRFSLFSAQAIQLGGVHFKLHERATVNSTLVGYGSALSRIDVDIHHAGEFANAKMNAIYLLGQGELFDLHSTIEHAVPNCVSIENARGIVGDNARAVFNGRIHIHRNAQKTLAELNNRNLLLSRKAIVNTKPELEIYADDVRCAHGATVAEIEESTLNYLRTRGIARSKALVMLNFGFIQELVNQIPNPALRDWLTPRLRQRFASMEVK